MLRPTPPVRLNPVVTHLVAHSSQLFLHRPLLSEGVALFGLSDRVRRAVGNPRAIPAGVARYLRGLRGGAGRVVAGPHSKVTGSGVWNIAGKVTVGVIGMPFSVDDDRTLFANNGTFNSHGHVRIDKGARVVVDNGATLSIGDGTFINCLTIVHAKQSISIGANCAISWRCELLDTNYHQLDFPGRVEHAGGIVIGNHVWIGAGCRLLPGTNLGDGCVVAAGSTVNGSFDPGTLVGGTPARPLRENVTWLL